MATCQQLSNLGLPTAYLSFRDHNLTPQVLENLDNLALLCLDDLDEILGNNEWEEAIFHAFNQLQTAAGNLIVTATAPPLALQFRLLDLQSRLSSGLILQIHALTDVEKVAALKLRAKCQGIKLSTNTALFLLNHYQRDFKSLFDILEKLAKAALIEKRALSIPFVKKVLKDILCYKK
jgi:DnaA family protein